MHVPHPAWIEVDVCQFRQNLRAVRALLKNSLFCLPVKANAYGHGISAIGRIAEEEGVDMLGVACLEEGKVLRAAQVKLPILVLGAIHEDQIEELLAHDLEVSLSSEYKARLVEKEASRLGKRCQVHLEVDTGMQRTGVRPETALELLPVLSASPWLQLKGVYSHFATADKPDDLFAKEQIARFVRLREKVVLDSRISPRLLWHLANSGGALYYPESRLDMARPGFLLYGGVAPFTKSSFSLKAKVSYFKVVEAGEGISYDHLYRTSQRTRVVTVPIGFGDGYKRAFSNKAPILLRGKRYQISGRVCMDQFMVDIGDGEGYVGDEVVLLGRQGEEEITLQELAKIADTSPYEILCSLNQRIPRYYV